MKKKKLGQPRQKRRLQKIFRKGQRKEISKQRMWQIRRRAAGLCTRCGQGPAIGDFCMRCRIKRRAYYRTLYRRQHRISLTAPLLTPGRPKLTYPRPRT